MARQPRRRKPTRRKTKRAARASTPPANAGTVAVERRRAALGARKQIQDRIREYKAVMGVAEAPARRGARRAAAAAAAAPPRKLRILAEGDSWFDYPPFRVVGIGGGGIIPRLAKLLNTPILNLAVAGDEVRFMLGVKQRKELVKQLTDGSPAGGRWDALLFSGGGNDIVDNPMALWVKDFDPTLPPAQNLNATRFDTALAMVRAGYEDLIELRNTLSPDTRLFFHAYDFAIPDGRGVCGLGPWLKPTFTLRRFPGDGAAGFAVVKEMLLRFAAMLAALAARPGVTFINAQGTLPVTSSSWHNELHPTRGGFDQFAERFEAAVRADFPGRL